MRHFSLLLLILIPSLSHSICGEKYPGILEEKEENVSGGFMGLGIGYGAGPLNISGLPKVEPSSNGPLSVLDTKFTYPFAQQVDKKSALSGFVGNLNFGYNWKLGKTCWVWGIIGGGSLTVMHANMPFASATTDNNPSGQTTYLSSDLTKTRLVDQGNFDAGMRLGYMFGRRVFAFTHLGWSIHRLVFRSPQAGYMAGSYMTKTNSWVHYLATRRIPLWINCFLVGLGIDVRLTQNTIIGFSVDTHIGFRSQMSFLQMNDGERVRFYMRPVIAQAMTTVKYFFPVTPGSIW